MDGSALKRQKSRDYPAVSLKKAIELARRIYEKDRWAEAPALTAARHMGYGGLNGGSRPALSALKKYGLLDYNGSGENLRVRLTDLAKRIFVSLNSTEKAEAVWEALNSPTIHQELLVAYPNWDLPSDETLGALLEREYRFQHSAVNPFLADLRESLDYARQFRSDAEPDAGSDAGTGREKGEPAAPHEGGSRETLPDAPPPPGLMKLPMPGSSTYIVLPETLDPAEAKRTLSWLRKVVTPAIEFVSGDEEDDEA